MKTATVSAMPPDVPLPTRRGEQTRALILETALRLFRERGYEETTMRAIAEEAGVAVGNTYYYFRSKEHLIQGLAGQVYGEHMEACRELLAVERRLEARLLGVMRTKLKVLRPYHRFAGVLAEPRDLREREIALFSRVVEGSATWVQDSRLRAELPELLWLYHQGILLYWLQDSSPRFARTERLLEHSVGLVAGLLQVANLPVLRPLVRKALELLVALKDDQNSPTNPISGSSL